MILPFLLSPCDRTLCRRSPFWTQHTVGLWITLVTCRTAVASVRGRMKDVALVRSPLGAPLEHVKNDRKRSASVPGTQILLLLLIVC